MSFEGPLTGFKILDFTQFESGTACTETLAWMGADVWKIEKPVSGESGRFSFENRTTDTYGFIILNMNKKSVTCDIKSEEGKKLLLEAVKQVDVVVENFGPDVMKRLGYDYESLKTLKPDIIYASIKGFGPDSPYRNYPAFSPIAQAVGGVAAGTGEMGGIPLQPGVNLADSDSGYMCAMAIIAALLQHERTGKGQKIEVGMQDTMIGLGRSNWEQYYLKGKVGPCRIGNGMPMENVAPADMFPCKPFGENDYVHIYCSRHVGSRQFEYLCKAIGREELLHDERYLTPQSRFIHKDTLNPVIAEWTGRHTKYEAMEILSEAGVPAGAVLDCTDIANDGSLLKSGTLVEVDHPDRGKFIVPGFVPKMSENHLEYECAPMLGEDNRDFYCGLLGLSDEKYHTLIKDGVI
jgi:formyl-CoA transferase